MGRAIMMILTSLIFTFIWTGHSQGAEDHPHSWESFFTQYRLLIKDDKVKLADRMLNNQLPEMEQYIQTLPPKHQEVWSNMLKASPVPVSGAEAERLLFFLEVAGSEDPTGKLANTLNQYVKSVENKAVTPVDLQQTWETFTPALMTYFDQEKIQSIQVSIEHLSLDNSTHQRLDIVKQLHPLIGATKVASEVDEALLWTIITIGGSIVNTLIYVALRKYRGRSRNRHNLRSDNS